MTGDSTERVLAGTLEDIPVGHMIEVPLSIDTNPPINALVANVHGSIHATTSRCTHYGLPLAKGVLTDDGRVYCPFHGACFRVATGDIEDAPAFDPLKKIKVQVEDGKVYLLVDSTALQQPTDAVQRFSEEGPHTVFVGGGAVALYAVQEMRRLGYQGRITVVTAEPHPTIDRPKLSKATAPQLDQVVIRDEAYWRERLGVDLRLSMRAYALDTKMNRVHLAGGNTVTYDRLVLCTGSTPRRLPIEGSKADGVYLLRTLEDAQALSAAVQRRHGQNLVIIGTGFIGMEMGIALARQANVTLIGQTHVPLEGPLSREVGYGLLTGLVNERPLRFLNAVDMVRIETDVHNRVIGVVVQPRANGSPELTLAADLVLMSTGAAPATQFLRQSPTFPPLRPDGSIEVDSALRVVGLSNVYAGGDIAAYPTESGPVRIEHWNVAANHGREIGRALATGKVRAYKHVPVFWSALGPQLRYVGSGIGYNRVYVDGDPVEEEFAAYYAKDDKVLAVATCVLNRKYTNTACDVIRSWCRPLRLCALGKCPSLVSLPLALTL